jgi:hypothetical protein
VNKPADGTGRTKTLWIVLIILLSVPALWLIWIAANDFWGFLER